jgi:hypothetical protein
MSGSVDVVVQLRAFDRFADLEESHGHGIHDLSFRRSDPDRLTAQ